MKTVGDITNEQHKRAFFFLSLGYTKEELLDQEAVTKEEIEAAEDLKTQGWEEGTSFDGREDPDMETEFIINKSRRYDVEKYVHDTETLYIVKRKPIAVEV